MAGNSEIEERSEVEVLLPEANTVTLVDGKEFTLPPVTWGREVRVLKTIKVVLKSLADSGLFGPRLDAEGNQIQVDEQQFIAQVLAILFDTAPDQITEAVAALMGKDKKWVEENTTAEINIGILFPFLRSKSEAIMGSLAPYLPQQATTMISRTRNGKN